MATKEIEIRVRIFANDTETLEDAAGKMDLYISDILERGPTIEGTWTYRTETSEIKDAKDLPNTVMAELED